MRIDGVKYDLQKLSNAELERLNKILAKKIDNHLTDMEVLANEMLQRQICDYLQG